MGTPKKRAAGGGRRRLPALGSLLWTLSWVACVSLAAPPAWIDDPYVGHPRSRHVAAVGSGGDRPAAANAARAELARVLEVRVQGTLETTLRGRLGGRAGEADRAVFEVLDRVVVETDLWLRGSEIADTWRDGEGSVWALAILDRAAMGASLRDEIRVLDARIRALRERARAARDPLERARATLAALAPAAEREALLGPLRAIGGSAPEAPPGLSAFALAEASRRALRQVAVQVEAREAGPGEGPAGAPSEALRAALAEVVTGSGLDVTPAGAGGTDAMRLEARLGLAPLDRGIPGHTTYRWEARFELRGADPGRAAVAAGELAGDESHPRAETARALARRRGRQALARALQRELSRALAPEGVDGAPSGG